jgi:cyanophycinase-like exopeptidase
MNHPENFVLLERYSPSIMPPFTNDAPAKADKAPIYLFAGGGRSHFVFRGAFEQIKTKRPSVAYVGAANGDDRAFFHSIAQMLRDSGAGKVRLAPMAAGNADLNATRLILRDADIIFLSGGDVAEGMDCLQNRQMHSELVSLYSAGKVFIGLSAGSVMLARSWILWRDEEDDSSAEILPCLGVAPILCDVHGEDDGWEELRLMLSLVHESAIGYGIPRGAMLRITPTGTIQAFGADVQRFQRKDGMVYQQSDLKRFA